MKPPQISVVVVFYNNRREAERTLFSLSSTYQKAMNSEDFEVIAIDNGSSKALDPAMVNSFGSNFKYQYIETNSISPCEALNKGISEAQFPYVMPIIDGAHMLSPGVLKETCAVLRAFPNAFVYTLPFHLGSIIQNESMLKGYNQNIEDLLLETVDWKNNGYQLFGVSEIQNANHSFFTAVLESNCFTVSKEKLLSVNGFDVKFTSKGGGLVNLDLFKKLVEDKTVKPVALIGEASFHQFHGGVSTNVKREKHPLPEYKNEYTKITGHTYSHPNYQPYYWGHFPKSAEEEMPKNYYRSLLKMARKLILKNEPALAVSLLETNKSMYNFNISYFNILGQAFVQLNDPDKTERAFAKMLELAPYSVEANVRLTDFLIKQQRIEEAATILDDFDKFENESPRIYLRQIRIARHKKEPKKVNQILNKLMALIRSDCNFMAGIYIEVGRNLVQMQKTEFAKQTMNKGLMHFKNNSTMLSILGRLAFGQKKYQIAEIHFTTAVKTHPNPSAGLFLALADVYLAQHKIQLAEESLRKGVVLEPKNQAILEKLNQIIKPGKHS